MERERQDYKGHRIELRAPEAAKLGAREAKRETEPVLFIDDEPISYGQLPDGRYFLEEYAYDWRADLTDLARGFIDYGGKAEETRRDERRRGE